MKTAQWDYGMDSLSVRIVSVGMLEVNCYILSNPDTEEALVVDPGDDAERIVDLLRNQGLTGRAVLLTHAHVDHIRGVTQLCRQLSVPVYLHPDDFRLYHSPLNALEPWVPAARDLPQPEVLASPVAGFRFEILHTPGHTPGSCSLHFREAGMVFTGDTLFSGSVGRTDLPGGDQETLMRSISEKLAVLPGETVVYPGHGPKTTIRDEVTTNPFLAQRIAK